MDDTTGSHDDWTARAVQILPTEHFTLQSARGATVADASSRATLFLSSVSISMVALGIVGQASDLGRPFEIFALILFPTLFFLGLTTFVRVTQSSIEDLLYARGINRIRHFYKEYAPEASRYFILSDHDDPIGALTNLGVKPTRWQLYLTVGGTIGVINSVVGGVAIGLAASFIGAPLWLAITIGIVAFTVSEAFHQRLAQRLYDNPAGETDVLFPSPESEGSRD